MADDKWTWILVGLFILALVYLLTRDRLVELTRDEQGRITGILEKVL